MANASSEPESHESAAHEVAAHHGGHDAPAADHTVPVDAHTGATAHHDGHGGVPHDLHYVDAHTGASQIHPELGSAAGYRKHSVFDVTWEEWKRAQWFGRGKVPADVPDAFSGASRYFSEEEHLLVNLQRWCRPYPWTVKAAQGLSHFGEHSLGWLALSGVCALSFPNQRKQWGWAALSAFGSHALSVIIKRIVRRHRPSNPAIDVNVTTPSELSFPSSHATSTTSWATSATMITHNPLPLVLSPIMMASRMLAGVHYPTDVVAGAALGAATSLATHKWGPVVLQRLIGQKNS